MLSTLALSAGVTQGLILTGYFLLLVLGSYLLGNISFARILARTQKDDITTHGSGNPGTANMLRTHGVSFGFLTMILDMLKGAVPCIVGFFAFGGFAGGMTAKIAIYVAGTSAVIGHIYPVFYKFKGGKGVATAAGMACVAHPYIALILLVAYILLLIITRISSLCSLIIAVTYITYDCITLGLAGNWVSLGLLVFVLFLIVWGHRANIKRLLERKENVIDLEAAVNKDVARISKHKQERLEKKQQKQDQSQQKDQQNIQENIDNVEQQNDKKED